MGWQSVLNRAPDYPGLTTEGFDFEREYEFTRVGEERIARYRMIDQHEQFNIAGLWFREPNASTAPQQP